MSHIADENDEETSASRRAREAQMPPALLRLRLENPGGATVIVQIRDVTSELGDFAVRPDTVTLEPGQTVEVEPMQSLLGVQSYALPVTITLRAAGQTQSKVLTLRPIPARHRHAAAAAQVTPADRCPRRGTGLGPVIRKFARYAPDPACILGTAGRTVATYNGVTGRGPVPRSASLMKPAAGWPRLLQEHEDPVLAPRGTPVRHRHVPAGRLRIPPRPACHDGGGPPLRAADGGQ